jgi:hypothetical protein
MKFANIYWDIGAIHASDGKMDDPLLNPIFMGRLYDTLVQADASIVTNSPAIHYITTIEVPEFAGLVEEIHKIFGEEDES